MSNQNNSPEEFDLFAPNVEDNLQEVLAKGSYKWTNKYTAVFAIALVVVTSASAGIWYGHRSAASSSTNNIAAAFGRSGRAGFGGNGASASAFASGGASASAGGFGGAAAGGFGGGRGTPGTVTTVKGKTVTITLDTDPTTPLKAGDTVSVRNSSGGQSFGGAAATTPTTPTTTRTSTRGASTPQSTSGATPAPSITGAGQPGGRGGGLANNPALDACLAKAGVSIAPGQRLDRSDPKVAAALQTCFSAVGGGFGARPSGAPTP